MSMLLLLLSCFSHVGHCATPQMAAHQAPPSPRLSRQEQWSGLPFPSPMHESEKSKWSRSALSDPMDCSLPGSSVHGIFQARILEWVTRLLIALTSLVAEHMLYGVWASAVVARGLSSCSSQAPEHRLNSCGTWGLAAPWHVRSSRLRTWTWVSYTGRWVLYQWAIREASINVFKKRLIYWILTFAFVLIISEIPH